MLLATVLVNVSELDVMDFLFNETSFSKSTEYKETAKQRLPFDISSWGRAALMFSAQRKAQLQFNSEVSSKIMSMGAHKCHGWAKTWEKNRQKSVKVEKNMK